MVTANAFRGLRFDPAVVGDAGAATAPSLDAADAGALAAYAASHPHNIARLLAAATTTARYGADRAAELLQHWIATGALVLDATPGVYAYEHTYPYGGARRRQRGVIASVPLDDTRTRILPHEQTMPGPVEERRRLLAATSVNLSPIFAVYNGRGRAAEVTAAMTAGPPLVAVVDPNGVTHRLWQVTDPALIRGWQAAVAGLPLLIADGHHRYDAALAHRAHVRAAHPRQPAGPWDETLMFLADADTDGPVVGAIHRLCAGVEAKELTSAAAAWADARRLHAHGGGRPAVADVQRVLAALQHDRAAFALLGRDGAWLLQARIPGWPPNTAPPDADGAAPLDAEVLHGSLLPDHAGGDATTPTAAAPRNGPQPLAYEPDPERAARFVDDGRYDVAVLLRPLSVPDVLRVARSGRTLPQKTTRFHPKPRDGLVLRPLTLP